MSQRGTTPWRTTMWSDPEFQRLTPLAQHLYFYLWTQSTVNSGGFLDLHVTKWAKASEYLTPEQVEASLDELLAYSFVMVDDDTEDLWLCRWIRMDVIDSPLFYKGALRAVQVTASRSLRHAAWKELCGLPRPVSKSQGINDDIDTAFEALRAVIHREGGKPFPNPSETLSKGWGEGAGEGEGEGVAQPQTNENCTHCHRHPVMERGLCAACLGKGLTQ
jgi:hypothetical protein